MDASGRVRNFLDLSGFDNAIITQDPFVYAIVPDLLNAEQAENLSTYFPSEYFYRSKREGGSDKTYNVENNILLDLDGSSKKKMSHISSEWKNFINFLQSKVYIKVLSNFLKINLSACYLEVTLKQYRKNDYISPHTDRSWVTATHLFFLNSYWENDWGGLLQLLKNNGEVLLSLKPTFRKSVVFIRSDNSWHGVTPVEHSFETRLSLQVAFWNTQERCILPGRLTLPINER